MITLLLALAADPATVSAAQVAQARDEAVSIRAAFNEEMLDFPSARFRDVRVSLNTAADGPQPYLCGYVNGKNRMGAYVGWQPFTASEGFLVIGDDEFSRDLVSTICDGPAIIRDPADRSDWLRHR